MDLHAVSYGYLCTCGFGFELPAGTNTTAVECPKCGLALGRDRIVEVSIEGSATWTEFEQLRSSQKPT